MPKQKLNEYRAYNSWKHKLFFGFTIYYSGAIRSFHPFVSLCQSCVRLVIVFRQAQAVLSLLINFCNVIEAIEVSTVNDLINARGVY